MLSNGYPGFRGPAPDNVEGRVARGSGSRRIEPDLGPGLSGRSIPRGGESSVLRGFLEG
jgi:hypothetical protein